MHKAVCSKADDRCRKNKTKVLRITHKTPRNSQIEAVLKQQFKCSNLLEFEADQGGGKESDVGIRDPFPEKAEI